MKLFHFYRKEDHSGVSGTGPVVEGVQFSNGWCALRWISNKSSMCFYQSIEEVKAIHGHGGKTEVIIHDFEPLRRQESPASSAKLESLMQIIEETSRLISSEGMEEMTTDRVHADVENIKKLLDGLEASLTKRTKAA